MTTTTASLLGIVVPTTILIAAGAIVVVLTIALALCLYALIRLNVSPELVMLTEVRAYRRIHEACKIRRRRRNHGILITRR